MRGQQQKDGMFLLASSSETRKLCENIRSSKGAVTPYYGDGRGFTIRMDKCSARLWGLHAAGARGLDVARSNPA